MTKFRNLAGASSPLRAGLIGSGDSASTAFLAVDAFGEFIASPKAATAGKAVDATEPITPA